MELCFNALDTAVWIYDIDEARIVWANQSALTLWDSPDMAELCQRDFKPEQSDAVKLTLMSYQKGFLEQKTYREIWHFTPNNKKLRAQCHFSGVRLEDGRMGMLVEALKLDDAINPMASSTGVIVSLFNPSGDFISANPLFEEIYGASIKGLSDLIESNSVIAKILSVTTRNIEIETDAVLKDRRGKRWYRIHATCSKDSGGNVSILLHNYDIHERKITELALSKQAKTDPLTGLLNRYGLTEDVRAKIKQGGAQKGYGFVILYLDLDGFKLVNDSFGHAVGDLLLVEVAERLLNRNTSQTIVSRFGGDEFVLFSESLTDSDQISHFCKELQSELSKPFKCIPGQLEFISVSIGCAIYPEDGLYFDQLISRADAAMYYAKNEGKKQHRLYSPEMELSVKRASSISSRLMAAVKGDQLSLHYQPILDVDQTRIINFEALLRWNDEQLGSINPEEIIQIAEKAGLIQILEQWVFRRALRDLTELRRQYGFDIVMSVNMSGTHLAKTGAGHEIFQLLKQANFVGSDLNIEITEASFIKSFDTQGNQVQELIAGGVNFSIDDFGTGYSSLAYLHKIPATTLKVDRAFVKGAIDRPIILESILKMANECNMKCVIEGIETQAESDFFRSLGYYLQQGYLFSKPQALSSLVEKDVSNSEKRLLPL